MDGTNKVFVCGAGHQGLAMAAHLSLNGLEVTLWNRTKTNIQRIIDTSIIKCTGIVCGDAKICKVSSDISEVVSDFVMVTTPSSAHRDVARELAPYVNENMIIVLNPGRTFGVIEFAEELKKLGIKKLPHIAETQTIVYTCRKSDEDTACIFALKSGVRISSLFKEDIDYIYSKIPNCLRRFFVKETSFMMTSLSNVGMILHCAPVLMNIGWIESTKVDFKYYYDGISKTVASFLEKLDSERLAVAGSLGCDIETVKDWMKTAYRINGENLYECLRNNVAYSEIDAPPCINTRYIYEDVPNGLVPVETIGLERGIDVSNITTIINLACSVMDVDYRMQGRKYSLNTLQGYLEGRR